VQGFEGGIGYSFNEETRFATFNIGSGLGTTTGVYMTADELPMVLTINPPTVMADASLSPTHLPIVLSVKDATHFESSIDATDKDMSWTHSQYGIGNQLVTMFTLVGSNYATLTSFPSWITVVDFPYYHGSLSVGYTLVDGNQIGIYPSTANIGVARSGNVVWTDNYGNVCTITVYQNFNPVDPTLNIEAGDPAYIPIYNTSGIVTLGDATLQFTFTPNNILYGYLDRFNTPYYVFRDGVLDSSGTLTNVRDETSNTRSVEMTSVAWYGEHIYVYIGNIV
jgi:hypothetical protein